MILFSYSNRFVENRNYFEPSKYAICKVINIQISSTELYTLDR